MIPETYADSIDEITLAGGVLRIDFVTLSATQKDGQNNPVKELRHRIIMPMEGYAGSFDLLKRVFDSLPQVPNRHRPIPTDNTLPTTAAARSANSSPNFR